GWLRFAIAAGIAARYIDEGPAGPLVQARAGYEGRGCTDYAWLCGYAGLDAAVVFARNEDSDTGQTSSVTGALGVGRAGIDLGARAVRLRLGAEAGIGIVPTVDGPRRDVGALDVALTAAIAVRW